MDRINYMKLQNGSDIRGVAMPGVEGEPVNLSRQAAACIGAGFLQWLREKKQATCGADASSEAKQTGDGTQCDAAELRIAIGRDPRLSGEELAQALMEGIATSAQREGGAKSDDGTKSQSVSLLDCGLASTPAMFMSCIFPQSACDGSIMITASHLPWNRNGFKFFDRDGGLQKEDITRILTLAEEYHDAGLCTESSNTGAEDFDLMSLYCDHLCDLITEGTGDPLPLNGMQITVDAGNGSGGFFATEVLEALGADISSSQYLEPDGHFPNHAPNPEDAAAMESISEQVKAAGSDLGLIFDTDVDRSAAVDNNGNEISCNSIVALAAVLVAEDYPGSTVVTDSITSDHLTSFLEGTLGLKHLRYRRGYKNVINKALELNEEGITSALAIETSGHAAMKDNYFLDDGAYLAARIVIKAAQLRKEGKTVAGLLAELVQPAESREVRMKITTPEFGAYGDRVLAEFEDWARANGLEIVEPNYEGIRLNFGAEEGNGWCLLRKSLHDPILPLNIESDEVGGMEKIAERLRTFMSNYDELDASAL